MARLMSLPLLGTANVDGHAPDLSDVLVDDRWAAPPLHSRLLVNAGAPAHRVLPRCLGFGHCIGTALDGSLSPSVSSNFVPPELPCKIELLQP